MRKLPQLQPMSGNLQDGTERKNCSSICDVSAVSHRNQFKSARLSCRVFCCEGDMSWVHLAVQHGILFLIVIKFRDKITLASALVDA